VATAILGLSLKGGNTMRTLVLRLFGARLLWLAGSLSIAATLFAAMEASAAGPPFSAGGTATTVSFTVTGARSADGVTLLDFTEHDTLSGTFSGTTVIQGSCVVNRAGDSVCRAVETFTGTVVGVSGTATFHDVVFIDASGSLTGAFTIVSGTGGLADLHGHGTFASSGGVGTYSGELVFAP
jgi:hypothetical protein